MKLTRINKPLRSMQVRITLAGDLNSSLENYARYYEHVHGDAVDMRVLISEMLRAFLEADREFQSWSRARSNGVQRRSTPAALPSYHTEVTGMTGVLQHPRTCSAQRLARRNV
jgi:hypothetical protein